MDVFWHQPRVMPSVVCNQHGCCLLVGLLVCSTVPSTCPGQASCVMEGVYLESTCDFSLLLLGRI